MRVGLDQPLDVGVDLQCDDRQSGIACVMPPAEIAIV